MTKYPILGIAIEPDFKIGTFFDKGTYVDSKIKFEPFLQIVKDVKIGSKFSFTIGTGTVYSGKGEIYFYDSNQVKTEQVQGQSSFGIIGFELGVIELLFGKRDDKITYSEFESVLNEEKKLNLEYKLDLSQWFFGLGLSF